MGRDVVHCMIASRHPSSSHPVERSFLCRCLRYHLSHDNVNSVYFTIPDSSGTQGPVVLEGIWKFWGETFPPEMPRMNTVHERDRRTDGRTDIA